MEKGLKSAAGPKASMSASQRQTTTNLAIDDHLIVHPGALATVLHLLTSISTSSSQENVSRVRVEP